MNKSKKSNNMLEVPATTLKAINEGQKRVKKIKKKYKVIEIQKLEDYFKELGIVVDSKVLHPGDYKDLFLEGNYKKDDILSITPGLYSPANSRFYASLLSLFYEQQHKKIKKEKEKNKKLTKELIDLFVKDFHQGLKDKKNSEG